MPLYLFFIFAIFVINALALTVRICINQYDIPSYNKPACDVIALIINILMIVWTVKFM
jgi:hypothetical protein